MQCSVKYLCLCHMTQIWRVTQLSIAFRPHGWLPKSNAVYVFIAVKPEINSFLAERQCERFLWLIFSNAINTDTTNNNVFNWNISCIYVEEVCQSLQTFRMGSDQKKIPKWLCGVTFFSLTFDIVITKEIPYMCKVFMYAVCAWCTSMWFSNWVQNHASTDMLHYGAIVTFCEWQK